ncbi:MAG: SRPBCC family protein [Candidatus Limnocylindria bacterium]
MDESSIVDREVRIAAPPDVVAAFFTDPAKVVTWFATRAEIRPAPGGALRLEFDRPGGSTDVVLGEFVEVSARRIVFTWGFEGGVNLPPGSSRVEVTLTPDGDGTRVRLAHVGLSADQRGVHGEGWTSFLERLGAVAAR